MSRTTLSFAAIGIAASVGCFGVASVSAVAEHQGRAPSPPPAPSAAATGMSLAEAAGKPHGIGARDLRGHGKARGKAAGAKNNRREGDGAVVNINGCIVGYGDGGQCLPAVPPSAAAMGHTRLEMPWRCQEVRLYFAHGVKLTGKTDVLKLDSNKDGVACGTGDA